ncbi:MAG: hypothetical protein KDH09_09195 [Chrysiogenetes bacterium]|nr:hypothetical protein [Chrysiogenetes bacterium]
MGFLALTASVILAAWTVRAVVLAPSFRDLGEPWRAAGIASLYLWGLSQVLSVFHWWNPTGLLGAQLIAALVIWLLTRDAEPPASPQITERLREFWRELSATEKALTCLVAAVLLGSFLALLATDLQGDARTYHGVRPLYWIQSGSVFPYESFSHLQMAMPAYAELLFAWPVLLSGSELAGRIFCWIWYPLCGWGLWELLRSQRIERHVRILVLALLMSASQWIALQGELKPAGPQVFWSLGVLYFLLRSRIGDMPRFAAAAAFCLALAIACKPTSLVLALCFVLLIPLKDWTNRKCWLLAGSAFVIGALGSGLAATAASSWNHFGSPLSLGGYADEVTGASGLRELFVHLYRYLVVSFFPLSPQPFEQLGLSPLAAFVRGVAGAFLGLAELLGLAAPLPGESANSWLGLFPYHSQTGVMNLGLLAPLGLLALAWTAIRPGNSEKESAKTNRRVALALIGALLALLWRLRWQPAIPRLTFFVIALCALPLATQLAARARALKVLGVLTGLQALAALLLWVSLLAGIAPAQARNEASTLVPVARELPASARVLFLGSGLTYEYDLFGEGRTLIPWGQALPTPEALRNAVDAARADSIVVDDPRRVGPVRAELGAALDASLAYLRDSPDWELTWSKPEDTRRIWLFVRRAKQAPSPGHP